jgi:hypothetical protein
MFYDKTIDIMSHTDGYKDDFGIWHNGSLVHDKLVECDVQPITKEIAFKTFGISENVRYRIFCDLIDGIKIGGIIQYNDKQYRIISLLEWDHLDFIVGDL